MRRRLTAVCYGDSAAELLEAKREESSVADSKLPTAEDAERAEHADENNLFGEIIAIR